MGESYRALCNDFYVNQKLQVKLDLPKSSPKFGEEGSDVPVGTEALMIDEPSTICGRSISIIHSRSDTIFIGLLHQIFKCPEADVANLLTTGMFPV